MNAAHLVGLCLWTNYKRKNVMLAGWQEKYLKEESLRLGISESEIIRACINHIIQSDYRVVTDELDYLEFIARKSYQK